MPGATKVHPRSLSRHKAKKRSPISSVDIKQKPWTLDDIAGLHQLAAELSGRPVPGLRLTATEFIAWCEPELKAEWVNGEVVLMSPEGWENVNFVTWLTSVLRPLVEERDAGVLLGREMLVRLPNQRRLRAPDLQFISKNRRDIIKKLFVDGAPDLVIESVSPSSATRDYRIKYAEYEKAGVPEYWVLDPVGGHAEAYALGADRKYQPIPLKDDRLSSRVIPGFYFRPKWLSGDRLPSVLATLRDLGVRA